jgi:HD-like signal output (HDOD) protein
MSALFGGESASSVSTEVDMFVIGNSTTVRRCFAAAARTHGLRCREAKDVLDAVAQLRLGVSVRLIVCIGPSAAKEAEGVRRSLSATSLNTAPIVAVANQGGAGTAFVPVAPIAQVLEALANLLPAQAVTFAGCDETALTHHMEAMRELNKAQALFLEVVDRVESDDLPGPMMPHLLQRLRNKLRDPDLSLHDLAEFIKPHQTLSARVMALANSALYSRGGAATSLRQALPRIGLVQTGRLLQAVATLEYEVGSDARTRSMIRRLLKESYVTALAADRLAEDCLHPQPADVYAAGLFHNIGSTFLVYTFALLFERGAVKAIAPAALEAIALAHRSALNQLLVRALELPDSLGQLDDAAAAAPDAIPRLVVQAAWVAERTLGSNAETLPELELDANAQMLALQPSAIKMVNRSLPVIAESLLAFK